MSGSVSKLYLEGLSIPQVSQVTGLPKTAIRNHLKNLGIVRTRGEALRLASSQGRLGLHLIGKTRTFSEAHCKKISDGRLKWGEKNAKNVSLKPNGYLDYTRGPNKGRSVHVVKMETKIGRRITKDECVHHIDECKTNNEISNLQLMTRSDHVKLHRLLEAERGIERKRKANGRFC